MSQDSAFNLADFDRYVEEHGISEEDYAAAFARWIIEHSNGRVADFADVDKNDDEEPPRDPLVKSW